MGLLERAVIASALTMSCYSPDTRDCTLTCARVDDCAGGQVCGTDHFCASPERAGHCATSATDDGGMPMPPGDASRPPPDARPADAPPDARDTVALTIEIMGPGTVVFDGVGSCNANCTLAAPLGKAATLHAVANSKQMFAGWTQGPCTGQGATCTFIAIAPATVAVRFMKADG